MKEVKKKGIPLSTIQKWMQSIIEHPGSDEESWRSERAEKELPFDEAYANVLPSKSLTPIERIAIYRRMFFLRMTESMAIDFPGVKHVVGEEIFDRLIADEYVQQYPSKSYTLNHLGRHFPTFIQHSNLPEKGFLFDLATLELAITDNMDAEESPLLTQEDISSVPQEKWETVRLIPIAALVLLESAYNVSEYLNAVTEESEPPPIKKNATYTVVYRNNYRTYWESLSHQQYTLLADLVSGKSFGDSLTSLVEKFPDPQEKVQQNLFQWFGEWVGNGYFSAIKI